MKEVFFYNWKREPVMQWSDLNIIGVEEAGLVSFDVKVSKSIFEASIRIKTELSELIDFKENLAKLFEQNILLTSSLRHPKRQDGQTMASMTDVRVSAS